MATAWINIAASVGGQIVNIIAWFKLLQVQAAVTGVAMQQSFLKSNFVAAGAGILAFVAIVFGGNEILKRIFPEYAKTAEETIERIKKSWAVDDVSAWLIQPFITAYAGYARLWALVQFQYGQFVNNMIITTNKLIEALTFGMVKSSIKMVPVIDYTKLNFDEMILKSLGLGKTTTNINTTNKTTGSTSPAPATALGLEMPEIEALRKQLEVDLSVQESQNDVRLEQMRQEQKALEVERDAIKAQIESKRALNETDQDIIVLESSVSNLDTRIEILGKQLEAGINVNISGGSKETKYGDGGAQSQEWAANYLAGLGSGSQTSPTSSPLSKEQLDAYSAGIHALTGVFIRDNGRAPNQQETIDISNQVIKTMPNIFAAGGYEGIVSKPTMFMVGEAGSEMVKISPLGRMKGSGGTVIIQNITVQGSILAEREVERIADRGLKRDLKRVGF